MALNRVGILTGGGDCAGLNAVIRSITCTAIIQHNCAVVGIEDGFEGIIFNRVQELNVRNTRDILPMGGTILGTSNKGNPFAFRELNVDGSISTQDYSDKVLKNVNPVREDILFFVFAESDVFL